MNKDRILKKLENSPTNVTYQELHFFCTQIFGLPRTKGSHTVFRSPWSEDPRINIHAGKMGKQNHITLNKFLGHTTQFMEMMMYNESDYEYKVIYSKEDQEYVGLCTEFSLLSYLASSKKEAIVGIESLVSEILADMKETGETLPVPLGRRHYSGKFQVRVSSDLHRKLVNEATANNVSLNHLITEKLAQQIAF